MMSDALTTERLAAAIKDTGLHLCVLTRVDSTNDHAKRMALEGAQTPLLVTANEQTAGRGRMGRTFYSPAETGAYFSILYEPRMPLESAVSVTGAAAVAVMRAIRRLSGRQTAIKWVNDLYWNDKKVCGILAEALSGPEPGRQRVILGIGINLSTEVFPADLINKAGSLHANLTRTALIAAVWHELRGYLEDPTDFSWLEDYRATSMVIGRPIEWRDAEGVHRGTACGINARGELEVCSEGGELSVLRTGEISVTPL